MLKILSILFLRLLCAHAQEEWSLVGNPLVAFYPCNDTRDVFIQYEPGKPPEDENEYILKITKSYPVSTRMKLKFDSPASVTLSKNTFARVSVEKDFIVVKFFKSHEGIVLFVRGPINTSVVPYMTYLNINNMEYCQHAKVGYIDSYIQGYKDHAEIKPQRNSPSCGKSKITYTQLIVNGEVTQPGDWPWHTAIYKLDKNNIKYICGGSLISKTFVLTAAHCTTVRGKPLLPELLSVVLGKYNLIGGDEGSEEREVHVIIVHEDFQLQYLHNDISLLKLKTEVTYNDYIQPACLWYKAVSEYLPTNQINGTVVGWGFDITDNLSPKLNRATSIMVSEGTCIKKNPLLYATVLTDRKFCAGNADGISACNGDSGGGYHIFVPDTPKDNSPNATGSWYVRGIVSLTARRSDAAICDPHQYTVFTDVAKFTNWIDKYIH
ncbi:chymotrypsin-like elastase family member 2A [Pieris brassicae]|uniref:chymotrypsin-like elastase family member 2A n=1 Tax=Pieris brassicae TaxID=7116 RepID=UPI001E65E664|nr:chymotrypsin-like elastase family member 2A [Pieris brassicae]